MVSSNRKSRKNKSRKNKSRKSIQRGGLFGERERISKIDGFGGGRFLSRLFQIKLTRLQRMKNIYDKLRNFIDWNINNGIMPLPKQGDDLVFSMFDGILGVINIQTADDVIALELLNIRTGSGLLFKYDDSPEVEEEKRKNIETWKAAGSPEPIVGDIMKDAVNILNAARDNNRFS